MPKNSAAQEKKVNTAVRFLQTTTGVKVPAGHDFDPFSKKDIAND
jgi:hypothetical protein